MTRIEKYRKKVRGLVLPSQVPGYDASLPDRMRLERIVKSLGVAPMLQFSYVAYAEQIVRLKAVHGGQILLNEVSTTMQHWKMRGLDGDTLIHAAEILGIPGASFPPEYIKFGHSSPCGTPSFQVADRIYGTRYTFAGPASKLVKMSFLVSTPGAARKIKCAVYNSPAAAPTTLVAETEEKTVNNGSHSWEHFKFPGGQIIGAGDYFLVYWADGIFNVKYDAGANPHGHHTIAYDGWPNTMPGWTYDSDRDVCICATLITG